LSPIKLRGLRLYRRTIDKCDYRGARHPTTVGAVIRAGLQQHARSFDQDDLQLSAGISVH
ncbi:MAG TPA: hypothetical protein VK832_06910, partial [Burkholderiaceae bacterium]|nr:hypothetical protein [Burkholderiaceae bacterium]